MGVSMNFRLLVSGIVIMSSTSLAQSPSETGASLVWTSDDPVIRQIIDMLKQGSFADAQSMLASDDGHASPQVAQVRQEMRELIARFRWEYGQTESQLLAKLRKSIPDVSSDDLKRWREAGQLQFKLIDGQVMYFRREPSNLFRFCDEAKKRRKSVEAATDNQWKLVDHLRLVVDEATKSGGEMVVPVRHKFEMTITIPTDAPGFKPGALVRVWMPYPQEYRQQKNVNFIGAEPAGSIAPNGTPQRSIYFEQRVIDATKPLTFKYCCEYDSFAYYPALDDATAQPLPPDFDRKYLDQRPPHIVFTPELRAKVSEIIGDETNPLVKARKIFHWIDQNVRYHAEEEYCLIPGFAAACLTRGRGDCGIQSTLFITMCRAAGIPARWQSGWETKVDSWTMHDWSEIYIAPWGWIPCDQSYGVQKSDDVRIRDFYLGHQDSHRMIVNLDYGRTLVPPKDSLRSEPADFQRGEVEIDGRNLYFNQWDYKVRFWVDGKEI